MKPLDWIIIILVAVAFTLAVLWIVKRKGNCCNGCTGDCERCKKKKE